MKHLSSRNSKNYEEMSYRLCSIDSITRHEKVKLIDIEIYYYPKCVIYSFFFFFHVVSMKINIFLSYLTDQCIRTNYLKLLHIYVQGKCYVNAHKLFICFSWTSHVCTFINYDETFFYNVLYWCIYYEVVYCTTYNNNTKICFQSLTSKFTILYINKIL